jgi:hypothetical protein
MQLAQKIKIIPKRANREFRRNRQTDLPEDVPSSIAQDVQNPPNIEQLA